MYNISEQEIIFSCSSFLRYCYFEFTTKFTDTERKCNNGSDVKLNVLLLILLLFLTCSQLCSFCLQKFKIGVIFDILKQSGNIRALVDKLKINASGSAKSAGITFDENIWHVIGASSFIRVWPIKQFKHFADAKLHLKEFCVAFVWN